MIKKVLFLSLFTFISSLTFAQPGATVWSDDFSVPGNWVVDNSGQSGATYGWTIDSNVDGWYFGGTTPDPIASTSGGNFAELNNGDPMSGTQALNVTYTLTTANAIPINTNEVTLIFNQYGAFLQDLQEVQISMDGTTWTPVENNSDMASFGLNGGPVYTNPMLKSVNLSSFVIAGTTAIWVRFSWTKTANSVSPTADWITYGWMIDDVSLVNNADYDLYTTASCWGTAGLNYYQIPLMQVAPIDFSANVTNGGTQTMTNSTLNVNVNSGAWTGTSAASDINSGASDSLFLSTQFTPSNTAIATYNVTRTITADSTDDIPGNNALQDISFNTTNYIYARDNGSIHGSTSIGINFTETGNLFDIYSDQTVTAINTYLVDGTTVGAEYYARIYRVIPTTTGIFVPIPVGITDNFIVASSDLNTELVLKLINPIILSANSTYLAVVVCEQQFGFEVANAGTSAPETSFIYNPTGAGEWYYQTKTPFVRLNFDPTVGLTKNTSEISVSSFYPNPTSGETSIKFNVANESNVTLQITDLTGKVVFTKTNAIQAGSNQLSFDASSYNSGVYYLTLSSDNGTVTKKFIKK
jgi:hypothetical protein